MMHAVDLHGQPGELFGGVASVLGEAAGEYVLAAASARYTARRARSCLLEPRAGDLVLFGGPPAGALYVLAILERDEDTTELAVNGDLTLRARAGCARVVADERVELATSGTVSIASQALEVHAERGELFVDGLAYVGRRVHAEVERIKTVASVVDRLFESVRERVKRSYRTIEEVEQVRAGSLDVAAQDNLRLHGRNTLMTAEAIVKLNGPQIHLG